MSKGSSLQFPSANTFVQITVRGLSLGLLLSNPSTHEPGAGEGKTMTSTPQRTPSENHHHRSLFFHDLSSPLPSSRRSSATTPIHSFPTPSPPPPPPILSLYDDPSPSHTSPFLLPTPEPTTPPVSSRSRFSPAPSPINPRLTANGYGSILSFSQGSPDEDKGLSPLRSGSPVEGLMGAGALVTLPPPREVVRPEIHKESQPVWELDEEVWVTVYGFSPNDTNLILREFEKCGEILRWVPGPREANWMYILYQSRFDAQKALAKHGLQLNNLLIVGVKRVDPLQQRYLNESSHDTIVPLPLADISPKSNGAQSGTITGSSLVPFDLPSDTCNNGASNGTIASPSKSVLSRVLDLMFGI